MVTTASKRVGGEGQFHRVRADQMVQAAAAGELQGERREVGGDDAPPAGQADRHRAGAAADIEEVQRGSGVLGAGRAVAGTEQGFDQAMPADEPPVRVFQAVHPLVFGFVHGSVDAGGGGAGS